MKHQTDSNATVTKPIGIMKALLAVTAALLFAAALVQAQTIPNPSFEESSFTVDPGYVSGNGGSLTGWTVSRADLAGLNPAVASPFADNGLIPDGGNVAFIQSTSDALSSLSTTITGLTPGVEYQLSFRANARASTGIPGASWSLDGGIFLPFVVNAVGGANPYATITASFTASGETAALTIRNQSTNDTTLLVDDFEIIEEPLTGPWTVTAWSGDASSEISPAETLWAYQIGTSTLGNINGMTIIGVPGEELSVIERFEVTGEVIGSSEPNNLTAQGGVGSAQMAQNFILLDHSGIISLEGLTTGQSYRVSLYGTGAEPSGAFRQIFSSGSDVLLVDPYAFGAGNGIRVDYRFVATSPSQIINSSPETLIVFQLHGLALHAEREPSLRGDSLITLECPVLYVEPGTSLVPAAITAGGDHSLALKRDGTLVAWGDNRFGALSIPGGLRDVVAVAGGLDHNVALTRNGTVHAWGSDYWEQTRVPGGLNDVIAIAAGEDHNLALKRDGTIVTWGDSSWGKTRVPSGLSGVVAVAGGGDHSLALKNDGTVVAWGRDIYGVRTVPGGLSDVIAIAAGRFHNLALRNDGTIVAWGLSSGGLTSVPAGLDDVVSISAGGDHNLALTSAGTVVAWGRNDYGQTTVPAGLSNVIAIATGDNHSLALLSDGTVVAWGRNQHNQTLVPAAVYAPTVLAGSVDSSTPGTYPLAYTFGYGSESTFFTRTVVIQDTLPPELTLNGDNLLILTTRPFIDPGATVQDLCAGSFPPTVTGEVNDNFPGIYTLTYSAVDPSGNAAPPVERTVVVAMPPAVPGDTDGDGVVSDAEFNAVRAGLSNELATQNAAGYYTEAQLEALHVHTPMFRQISPGRFRLTIGMQRSANLASPFTDFSMDRPNSTLELNAEGKLEFEFPARDNAAFFLLKTE